MATRTCCRRPTIRTVQRNGLPNDPDKGPLPAQIAALHTPRRDAWTLHLKQLLLFRGWPSVGCIQRLPTHCRVSSTSPCMVRPPSKGNLAAGRLTKTQDLSRFEVACAYSCPSARAARGLIVKSTRAVAFTPPLFCRGVLLWSCSLDKAPGKTAASTCV